MRIIVGCEKTQAICIALRRLGHEAYSCDLQDATGGKPEWHIKGDIRKVLYDKWDGGIFHPVCKRLANSGRRWIE